MAKLYFVKMPNIAASLQDKNRPRPAWQTNKKEHKNSYFRSHSAKHNPISIKLGMWIEDVCTISSIGNCFEIRPLIFGLGSPPKKKFWWEITNEQFLSYKFLMCEPNLTKFLKNGGTTAAHIPCEFHEYQLREMSLRDGKVTKISDFLFFFLTRNLHIWTIWGQIWQVVAVRHTQIWPQSMQWLAPVGRKTEKVILMLAVFCW